MCPINSNFGRQMDHSLIKTDAKIWKIIFISNKVVADPDSRKKFSDQENFSANFREKRAKIFAFPP